MKNSIRGMELPGPRIMASDGAHRMSKKTAIKNATEAVIGLARLAFIGIAAAFLIIVTIIVLNLAIYLAARVSSALFDLLKNGIFRG